MANPYEIVPRVWFGPAQATLKYPTRFTHIINCETDPHSTSPAAYTHVGPDRFLFLYSEDDDDFPILSRHLKTANDFIDAALRTDPAAQVYIHCVMGLNRSGALAVAYAITHHPFSIELGELIALTRRGSHRLILTNNGFVRQLRHYVATLSNTDPRI